MAQDLTGVSSVTAEVPAGASAASSEEEFREPLWDDALFRQRRKHGKYREVPAPVLEAAVPDSHTHVHLTPQPAQNLARCAVWGVDWICNVVDVAEDAPDTLEKLAGWRAEARDLVEGYAATAQREPLCDVPHISIIAGVHPHNAKRYDDALEARMLALLADPRVCGIGEAGLDFHYDFSPRDVQVEMFKRHIRLARQLDLPLCLHIREAHDLAFEILEQEGWNPAGCVLHCFNLDPQTLKPWIERGCYVGFDGPLTFRNASEVREAACLVPDDRLLIETDAPYMTPEPMRGMVCGPQHVIYVADMLANVRGYTTPRQREELIGQLKDNTRRVYGRGPRPWQTGNGV